MKFKVDYDILDIINQSKHGYLKKSIEAGTVSSILCLVPSFLFINEEVLKELILTKSISILISFSFLVPSVTIMTKKIAMESAEEKLDDFTSKLYDLEVRTNKELLKESKLNSTKHRFVYIDKNAKIPVLKQYKYIDVPLSNGYEETILQEHIIGEKDYEISVKSPEKKHVFKLSKAKNGI